MKKLTEEDLEDLNGGASIAGCISQVTGAWGVLLSTAAIAAGVATGGLAIAGLALGAASLGFGIYADPYACGY